eukprot:COSAG06_NODE_428_length_15883_cov_47.248289_3_plen_117_part_00
MRKTRLLSHFYGKNDHFNKTGSGQAQAKHLKQRLRVFHRRLRSGVSVPYYDVHKLLAGLLDRYALLQDARSLRMAAALADYFLARIRNVIRLNGTATWQVRKRPSAPLFIHLIQYT